MVFVELSKTELRMIIKDLHRPFIYEIEELRDKQAIAYYNLSIKLQKAYDGKRQPIINTFTKEASQI